MEILIPFTAIFGTQIQLFNELDKRFKEDYLKPPTMEATTVPNIFCTITLPDDIPEKSPVYLKPTGESFKLFRPTGKVTFMPRHSRLLLACPGRNNAVKNSGQNLELICREGKNFVTTNNVRYTLKELPCTKQPISKIRPTQTPCSNYEGKLQEIGFEYNGNNFAPLFSICYNTTTSTTLYTHNTINGAAINYDVKKERRPLFTADGMGQSTPIINNLYIQAKQRLRFAKLFGSVTAYYDDNQMFLSRGHFTADADMVFAYEKLATYYYVNAAPQYQIINGGNWQRVEDKVRELAADYGSDFVSYNGPMYILKLPQPNAPNTAIDVCLDENIRICAPKYYFKVIKARSSGIVFITSNNPHATEVDVFCRDVCSDYGVDHPNFKNYTLGYTFCCELLEFTLHNHNLTNNSAES